MFKKSGAWKKWLVALMVLGVGGYFVQRQMGGETASLEPPTAPAIHDINETERKLDDLKLLFDGGYTDKDETKFAKEVLEIDASQITDKEKERSSKSPTATNAAWKACALSNKTRTPHLPSKISDATSSTSCSAPLSAPCSASGTCCQK